MPAPVCVSGVRGVESPCAALCSCIFGRVTGRERSGWYVVELSEFGPDDEASVQACVDIENACLVDAPWWHPSTVFRQTMLMRHGWDGEIPRCFLVEVDGSRQPVGRAALHTGSYDNLDVAWVELAIRPECRRRGYGTAAMQLACEVVRSMGRSKVGWFGWVGEQT